ncbi:MAG: helix-turn-helix domain-containing protein [Sphingomonas sp.]|nr:helix-turn-helix domain-containing protein [Sphingomonas sp.]
MPSNTLNHDPLAYSIAETCRVTSLGRTRIYELAREGKLDLIKLGRRSLITAESIKSLLDSSRT